MAEPEEDAEETPKKRSKKPLLIGVVLALVLGGGGFFAVFSGMILAPPPMTEQESQMDASAPLPDVVFVEIQPMVVNLGTGASARFLRFQAQLEVRTSAEQEVVQILPRVVDVLNGYLRAVEISDLEKR
ncbi:MAG: flagellar basal body-associated protein FliL, partial [Paracoccaceae bacterium]